MQNSYLVGIAHWLRAPRFVNFGEVIIQYYVRGTDRELNLASSLPAGGLDRGGIDLLGCPLGLVVSRTVFTRAKCRSQILDAHTRILWWNSVQLFWVVGCHVTLRKKNLFDILHFDFQNSQDAIR